MTRRAVDPLCVELYCGTFGWSAGWLALGGRAVGFDIVHEDYHGPVPPRAHLVIQDVRTLHGRQFRNAALILGSSPCQEFSYRAMPWKRARELPPPDLGIELFEAQFRIQREASEAAGRHIPLVVENVRGAQKWVGRARWHYGSYYLWGDVPALMPPTLPRPKRPGHNWSRFADTGETSPHWRMDGQPESGTKHNPHRIEPVKNRGGSWFKISHNRVEPTRGDNPVGLADGRAATLNDAAHHEAGGVKGFTPDSEPLGKNKFARRHGSKSKARRKASALIARIPYTLSLHIAQTYFPVSEPRTIVPPPAGPVPIGAVIPAVVGELVNLPGLERAYTAERCTLEDDPRAHYACLSCRQLLGNATQLAFHLEAGAAHVVARECREHGWEAL
jgi:hypothetical protein